MLLDLLGGIATLLVPPILMVAVLSTSVGVGLMAFPRALVGVRRWAEWNRRRAAELLGVTVASRSAPLSQGIQAQWRQVLSDPGTRHDLRWTFQFIVTGILTGLVALFAVLSAVLAPLWWLYPADAPIMLFVPVTGWTTALVFAAIALSVVYWGFPPLARFQASRCLAALEPSAEERLTERVGELGESRAAVLDAHGAELRRIERDLHDGTQARLVAIAIRLGVAREALTDDAGPLAKLLKEAHEGAEEAMVELRDVIRTMYPPILADRGLAGALTALGARSTVPVEVDLGDVGRLSAAVEAAAYFIVAETLTNVSKHSCATRVIVRLTRDGDRLLIEVTDDGIGGVDEARGTGVIGIRRRAAALDGTVQVTSPVGGPTAVTVELPCAS